MKKVVLKVLIIGLTLFIFSGATLINKVESKTVFLLFMGLASILLVFLFVNLIKTNHENI